MSIQLFLLFLLTWSLVALAPGPAVMCTMTQASRYGFRSSLAGISGIQLGNVIFFTCNALGLGVLLATATTAFTVLRFVGAAYLIYLGAGIVLSTFRRSSPKPAQPAVASRGHDRLFLQGLLVQLTNPKALLFVSALLPQFIQPPRSMLLQLVILLLTTIAVDLIVLSSYAFLAQRGVQSFRASGLGAWLQRIFGAALCFFGLRLLLSRK